MPAYGGVPRHGLCSWAPDAVIADSTYFRRGEIWHTSAMSSGRNVTLIIGSLGQCCCWLLLLLFSVSPAVCDDITVQTKWASPGALGLGRCLSLWCSGLASVGLRSSGLLGGGDRGGRRSAEVSTSGSTLTELSTESCEQCMGRFEV